MTSGTGNSTLAALSLPLSSGDGDQTPSPGEFLYIPSFFLGIVLTLKSRDCFSSHSNAYDKDGIPGEFRQYRNRLTIPPSSHRNFSTSGKKAWHGIRIDSDSSDATEKLYHRYACNSKASFVGYQPPV